MLHSPESGNGARTSRPHDVWSLGNVFFLMLAWCIEGAQGYERLERLLGTDSNPLCSESQYVLDPWVMKKLHDWQTGSALEYLVGILRSMLDPHPHTRITAASLEQQLEEGLREFD